MVQQLSEKQKAQKYKYRKEDGKYLSSFFSILKLVLINGELFSKYLERSIVETEKNRLNALIPKDIHYIINVQSEEEKDMAYLVTKEEKRIWQTEQEQGFFVKWADSGDIKRILAVYYEHNVTTERFEDFDGKRWIIPEADEF